jgi:hypothetical protein
MFIICASDGLHQHHIFMLHGEACPHGGFIVKSARRIASQMRLNSFVANLKEREMRFGLVMAERNPSISTHFIIIDAKR